MAVLKAITPHEAEVRLAQVAQRLHDALVACEMEGVFGEENMTTAANAEGGTLTLVENPNGSTIPWPAPMLARAQTNYAVLKAAGVWGRTPIATGPLAGKSPLQHLQGLIRSGGGR